jgi:two-component system, NtrC family, sensor histidine kinase HydH
MLDAPPVSLEIKTSCREGISTIGWLSTSIAHDLRNPLGTICAGAEMLMDQDMTPAQVKRLAANIHRAAGRMRELLEDLAGVARGKGSISEVCELREVIAAAARATESRAVQIILDAPHPIELQLVRSRMQRVFFNLIANSVEAMPSGGKIRIRVRKTGDCVLVELEDTGPGIAHRIRDSLFQPFVTDGKKDGLGLGLALCRQTVLDHGGEIWNEPAAGARFVIRLPASERGTANLKPLGSATEALHLELVPPSRKNPQMRKSSQVSR